MLQAFGGQLAKLRWAIVLGGAQFDRNPPPLDESVQFRVARPLFGLQHIRVEFDGLRDGVAVRWALQDWQEFDAFPLLFSRHSR